MRQVGAGGKCDRRGEAGDQRYPGDRPARIVAGSAHDEGETCFVEARRLGQPDDRPDRDKAGLIANASQPDQCQRPANSAKPEQQPPEPGIDNPAGQRRRYRPDHDRDRQREREIGFAPAQRALPRREQCGKAVVETRPGDGLAGGQQPNGSRTPAHQDGSSHGTCNAQRALNSSPQATVVNGGGIMLHARRPGGPVAAAQNCATHGPLSVATRGRRCTAWSSMRRFDWRLSTRV